MTPAPGSRPHSAHEDHGDLPPASGTRTLSPAGPSPVPEEGRPFGPRYLLLRQLGKGGMGEVWKARDRELDQTVALKMIRPDLIEDPALLERFKRETTLARMVTHRNVCRIYDIGEVEGTRFISMEYLEGSDLKALIRREGPLPKEKAVPIAIAISEGLKAAHDAGVVHRDLKPQNIFIDRQGFAHVMDFGIAFSGETAGLTRTGALLGTPEYMSPEQVRGERLDERSDIFSLGLILYEMVTGDVAFAADSVASSMYRRLVDKPRRPREIREEIPLFLEKVILRCLEKEPAFRYQSVGEILADLRTEHAPRAGWGRVRPLVGWKTAVAGALVATLVVAGILIERRGLRWGRPAGSARTLALLPFENATGNPSLDWTRSALPALMADRLDGFSGLRLLDGERTQRALETLKLPLTGSYTPFDVRRAASVLGADFVATGRLSRAGSRLQVQTHLQRQVGQGLQEAAAGRAEGTGEDAIFDLAARMTGTLATGMKAQPPRDLASRRVLTRSVEALGLYAEALELYRSGRFPEAARRLEGAVGKDPQFAVAQALLSQAYARSGDRERAVTASDLALKNSGALTDHEARLARARQAVLQGRIDRGIEEYRGVIGAYPQDSDARVELAAVLEQKGDLAGAAAELQRCVTLDPALAPARFSLGFIRMKQGDHEAALKIFSDLLAAYTQAGDDVGTAKIYHALGNMKMVVSQYADALRYYRQALEVMTRLDDKAGMASTLENMASILRTQGKYPEALQAAHRSLDLRVEVGDPRGIAYTWIALGEIDEDAGQIREAKKCYEESLKITRDLNDPSLLARNLSSLGYVSSVLGDYSQAYLMYQEALGKRREVGDKRELLKSLIEIGLIEQWQGRYDKALDYATESMTIAREIGEKAGAVVVSTNVGMIDDDQGSYGPALKALREALEGARAIGDQNLVAAALVALGGTLAHLGSLDEATRSLAEAERLIGEIRSDVLAPELLSFQAEVAGRRGETERCLKLLNEALRRAESLADRRLVLLARLNLGRWLLATGRPGGSADLERVAQEAGSAGIAPLRVRALSYVAASGDGLPDAARAAKADQAVKEGRTMRLREALVPAYTALARRAAAKGDTREACDRFLQVGALTREMADGLQEPYGGALLGRADLVRLTKEAQEYIRRSGTPAERQAAESSFPGPRSPEKP
jgi:tetratricopeptide (TPR) repeat protein